MTENTDVTFHRTHENRLAARLDGYCLIALPRGDGRISVWSAYEIAKPPEDWTSSDFYIGGANVVDEHGFIAHAREFAQHKCDLGKLARTSVDYCGHTPWGTAQSSQRYGAGVVFHSTAGHGGFDLDEGARAKIDLAWNMPGRFFEEDVDWAIVAFTFPDLFTAYERKCADETLRHWRPDAYEAITGIILAPGGSRVKDECQFRTDHANDLVVISAISSTHRPGFVECIATLGGDRRSGAKQRFLVPLDEYDPAPFGFVIDVDRHNAYDGPSSFAAWTG